jgi:hypothetical protein
MSVWVLGCSLGKRKFTSQFVAVRGTREKIHPSCEGRSEVSRTYLPRRSKPSSQFSFQYQTE